MAFRKSKYSVVQNQDLEFRTLDVLANAPIALTIEEICLNDLCLVNQTTQKMARILNELCDKGLAVKAKSRSRKRMVYASVQTMLEQGFDVNSLTS